GHASARFANGQQRVSAEATVLGAKSRTVTAHVERRLEAIRGIAPHRSRSIRTLAGYADHTDCNLATLAFSAGVDLDRLLVNTRFKAPFGQSPFAFRRGLAFEQILRNKNYALVFDLLRTEMEFPVTDVRFRNLRDSFPKTSAGMLLRAQETLAELRRILRGDPTALNLIDGAVMQTSIGGVAAFFEADALAMRSAAQLHVAEVKSFPRVDDRIDP